MGMASGHAECHLTLFQDWGRCGYSGLRNMGGVGDDEKKKRFWNCDETGFCLTTKSKKVLAKRGDRDVHETVGGSGREYITLLGAACANGTRLPPYILYSKTSMESLDARWSSGSNVFHIRQWFDGRSQLSSVVY